MTWASTSSSASWNPSSWTGGMRLGLVGAGGMLANVVGVPLGAFAGQLGSWRGPFWALAGLALAAVALVARQVSPDAADQDVGSLRSEFAAMRSRRLWLVLAACATMPGGVLSAYSSISPMLADRGIASRWVTLVLVGFGLGSLIGAFSGGGSETSARTPPRSRFRRPGSSCWGSAWCRRTPSPRWCWWSCSASSA